MTSATIQMERFYPAGHRNRHSPRLCPLCRGPLTANGDCTRCRVPVGDERPHLPKPARIARLERMERAAHR